MSFARATIAGAGLAGLSAAVALRGEGLAVRIADAAAQAGGRCRSYRDPQFGRVIDNGNHLVLSGNEAVARFRRAVGAQGALTGPEHAEFAFFDCASGARWQIAINDGRLPWWVTRARRRVPGTRLGDYLPLARLLGRGEEAIGARIACAGPVWERLLFPVLVAVLNTPPEIGSTRLAANVLHETMLRGGKAMRPLVAQPSLSAAFIDPALEWLAGQGSAVALKRRLRSIGFAGDRVITLDWGEGPETVADDEAVVLALPPWVARDLVPGISAPDAFHSIVNVHFDHPAPAGAPPMLGLVGGTAEWIFAFEDRLSVTISAADALVDAEREEIARRCWSDICKALELGDAALPLWQVVKEKRATFSATPAQNAKRPPSRTRWNNLFLAGDWIQTGLPATIEGALRSGETAARLISGYGQH